MDSIQHLSEETAETWIVDRVACLHQRAIERNLPPELAEEMASRWYALLLGRVLEILGGEQKMDDESGEFITTPSRPWGALLPLLKASEDG